MKRTFEEALAHRRTYYSIGSDSPVLDEEIVHVVREAVKNVPSAFNSQSTRIVLLLGDEHRKLWDIVKATLKPRISAEAFVKTEAKIDSCFACGHGTVLYFEDTSVVKKLQDAFPSYKDNFPTWSQHTSAMHQFAIWTMLEDLGLGASLQHYNPLIDDEVRRVWSLPEEWELIAEMPFGMPVAEPGEKDFEDLSKRIKIFR
ncbi:nitroreductase family protein [Bacteroides helcogenes]|uniref:Nitroreductase n=1 Tax=Bacteroides helcogenes (strain ATCC 35417 / DSM 20613 / JCM 6297 / CCUG 15421 / P 36-108) TaxID=693979 RepID=E6SW32_BACT6|nr:nitroreductase family protein [Bacteroides helcogenes]ADV42557.1 nitroreductase [Bacteroides helcogenes P 36-108]MDY5237682.1 nitroreductase family protein [Bacteroides helcogenes]